MPHYNRLVQDWGVCVAVSTTCVQDKAFETSKKELTRTKLRHGNVLDGFRNENVDRLSNLEFKPKLLSMSYLYKFSDFTPSV